MNESNWGIEEEKKGNKKGIVSQKKRINAFREQNVELIKVNLSAT